MSRRQLFSQKNDLLGRNHIQRLDVREIDTPVVRQNTEKISQNQTSLEITKNSETNEELVQNLHWKDVRSGTVPHQLWLPELRNMALETELKDEIVTNDLCVDRMTSRPTAELADKIMKDTPRVFMEHGPPDNNRKPTLGSLLRHRSIVLAVEAPAEGSLVGEDIRLHKSASNNREVISVSPLDDLASDLRVLDLGANEKPPQHSHGLLGNPNTDKFMPVLFHDEQTHDSTSRILSTTDSVDDPLSALGPEAISRKLRTQTSRINDDETGWPRINSDTMER